MAGKKRKELKQFCVLSAEGTPVGLVLAETSVKALDMFIKKAGNKIEPGSHSLFYTKKVAFSKNKRAYIFSAAM